MIMFPSTKQTCSDCLIPEYEGKDQISRVQVLSWSQSRSKCSSQSPLRPLWLVSQSLSNTAQSETHLTLTAAASTSLIVRKHMILFLITLIDVKTIWGEKKRRSVFPLWDSLHQLDWRTSSLQTSRSQSCSDQKWWCKAAGFLTNKPTSSK